VRCHLTHPCPSTYPLWMGKRSVHTGSGCCMWLLMSDPRHWHTSVSVGLTMEAPQTYAVLGSVLGSDDDDDAPSLTSNVSWMGISFSFWQWRQGLPLHHYPLPHCKLEQGLIISFPPARGDDLSSRTSKACPPCTAPTMPIPLTSPLDGEKKFFLPHDEPMHALGATLNSMSHLLKGAQVRITFVFSQLFFHQI
jgi:hypothetical protein